MGYTPMFRDVETGDKNSYERKRCSCIGFLGICVAMMIFGIVIMIPGMLDGSIIFAGGIFGFARLILLLFGPFVICALVIKLGSEYREKSETGNLQ